MNDSKQTNIGDEMDEYVVRTNEVLELKKEGEVVYKDRFDRTHMSVDVANEFPKEKTREFAEITKTATSNVAVAGRVMAVRSHGKISFLNIQDNDGQIQIALKEDVLGEERYLFLTEHIRIADFVGIKGEPFFTNQDKLAILATDVTILTKALRPIPKEHFGIEDIETKYRQRYLDLILNPDVQERFRIRSKVVRELRDWLHNHNFIEITTRSLQSVAGGAMAETFKTHHNALDEEFSLRISPELDLKTAMVGGFERVFEFAINFRNEGMDPSHVQEFQMLEWYCAYENYEAGMDWTEEMLKQAVEKSLGKLTFNVYDKEGAEHGIDFSKPIPRIKFTDLLKEHAGIDMIETSTEDLIKKAIELGIDKKEAETRSRGNLLDDIYKKTARPKLIQPVFVTHYPVEIVPLARPLDEDPKIAESYQLVIASWEIVKAYSELVDPIIQREKFEAQALAKADGDKEAMDINEEFLTAMEHGMPPITGWGMGIERFVTLITGQKNLRDVVLFPTVKKID